MKTIDINWLRTFESYLDKQDRGVSNYRQCSRCNKEVFTIRYFNKFLTNKTFKLRIEDKIYYAMFVSSSITNSNRIKYKTTGATYYLGYTPFALNISFLSAVNVESVSFRNLKWNDITNILYEEIENEKFYEVCKLFM
jgi:hypothetical protein